MVVKLTTAWLLFVAVFSSTIALEVGGTVVKKSVVVGAVEDVKEVPETEDDCGCDGGNIM